MSNTSETIYIDLLLDGKEKRYIIPSHIPTRKLSRAVEIAEMFEKEIIDPEHILIYIEYLVDTFDHQFSVDELEEGLDSKKLMRTVYSTAMYVVGRVSDAMRIFNGTGSENVESESDIKKP